MKRVESWVFEWLTMKSKEIAGLLGDMNGQFNYREITQLDLEGPAPEGVDAETWRSFLLANQALMSELNTFVHHYGAKVVIDRGRRA